MLRSSQMSKRAAADGHAPSSCNCVLSFLGLAILAAAAGAACPPVQAQTGQWAWMGGSSAITESNNGEPGQRGVYGELGKAGETNIPGGRLGAVSWTDIRGHLWLFGGAGIDSTETFGFLNDLWEFDPANREWIWVSGGSSIESGNGGLPGEYGTMGVPHAGNTPGSRSGAVGWTDDSGNLWLFGGAGFDADGANGNLNDLWEFNPATREWAWMGGSNVLDSHDSAAGIYGALGSFTAGSYPGSRDFAVAWTGKDGMAWLYGGFGGDAPGEYGQRNDLWAFRPSTGQWALMGGGAGVQLPAIYGKLGVPSATGTPGSRDTATAWVSPDGHLWLFGGYGFQRMEGYVVGGYMNDLWEFDPATHEWAWRGGSKTLPGACVSGGACGWAGEYGTLGKAAAGNIPGSRASAIAWVDQGGNAWIFGGSGYDANGNVSYLNDLWERRHGSGEWAWMGGSSDAVSCLFDDRPSYCPQPGSYGLLGQPTPSRIPGGRQSAVGWTDIYGNRWLMAGDGADSKDTVGDLNDLWEYELLPAMPRFSVAAGTYDAPLKIKMASSGGDAVIYFTLDGQTPNANSTRYTAPIEIYVTTTIKAIAVSAEYGTSEPASATYTIKSKPSSSRPETLQ